MINKVVNFKPLISKIKIDFGIVFPGDRKKKTKRKNSVEKEIDQILSKKLRDNTRVGECYQKEYGAVYTSKIIDEALNKLSYGDRKIIEYAQRCANQYLDMLETQKLEEPKFSQEIIEYAIKQKLVDESFQYNTQENFSAFIKRKIGCKDINNQIATAIVVICSSFRKKWNYAKENDCIVDLIDVYLELGATLAKRLNLQEIKESVQFIKSSYLKIPSHDIQIQEQNPQELQYHEITWEHVSFDDGYLYIKDPFNVSSLPLRITLATSKKTFEYIKPAFSKKLPPIKVIYTDGNMRRVEDKPFLGLCVQSINRLVAKTTKVPQIIKKPVEKKKLSISALGVLGYIQQLNSKYLNYLSSKQVSEYAIYYCKENKDSESNDSTSEDEDAFIFTTSIWHDQVNIVYENTNPSRSTYTFIAHRKFYKEAIKEIGNFFSSDNRNKRQMLMRRELRFNSEYIMRYYRTMHTDYFSWKRNLPL